MIDEKMNAEIFEKGHVSKADFEQNLMVDLRGLGALVHILISNENVRNAIIDALYQDYSKKMTKPEEV